MTDIKFIFAVCFIISTCIFAFHLGAVWFWSTRQCSPQDRKNPTGLLVSSIGFAFLTMVLGLGFLFGSIAFSFAFAIGLILWLAITWLVTK